VETYFTFEDGALRYDCVTCGAKCCKGFGIGLDRAGAERLCAERPALRAFVRVSGGGTVVAANVSDGCWFLDAERLCGLERTGGRTAKPPACRLFPFNRLFRVGGVRVVDANTLLCPLEDARGAGVSHAELLAELEELGDRATWAIAEPPAGQSAAEALAEERAAARACAEAVARGEAEFAVVASAMGGGPVEELRAARAAAARLLGLGDAVEGGDSAATARVLARVAPSLRFNARFGTGAGAGAGAGARVDSVARWLVMLELLLRAGSALGAPPTLRAATELFQARRPLLAVLARAGERLHLDPAAGLQLSTEAPAELQPLLFRLAGALARNRGAGRTLEELLTESAPDALARALLLPWAAALLPARS